MLLECCLLESRLKNRVWATRLATTDRDKRAVCSLIDGWIEGFVRGYPKIRMATWKKFTRLFSGRKTNNRVSAELSGTLNNSDTTENYSC